MSGFGYFLFGLATGFVLTCLAVSVGMVYQAVTKVIAVDRVENSHSGGRS